MSDFEIITALITPFQENGRIDLAGLQALIRYQLASGVRSFVLFGTTGEGCTIPLSEKREAVRALYKTFRKTIDIIVGISGISTQQMKEEIVGLRRLPIASFLCLSPCYLTTNDQGIVEHFTLLADTADHPIYMYYVPKRTGQKISLPVFRILRQHPKILGVKYAYAQKGALEQMKAIQTERFRVLLGNDDMLLDGIASGMNGIVSVYSNAYPKTLVKIASGYDADPQAAKEMFLRHLPLMEAMFAEPNPIPIKYFMKKRGFSPAIYHAPLYPPTQETIDLLNQREQSDED